MPLPTTEQLKRVKSVFLSYWNFPNCVGAIDGKHCRIKCPPNTGTLYYNYAKFFRVVLQGVADAEYRLITVEVRGRGIQSDGGTFSASALYDYLESSHFNMPPDEALSGATKILPNVLLGDEAYPLKTYLLKPYFGKNLTPERSMFRYRLSRARRCIECAFRILYSK